GPHAATGGGSGGGVAGSSSASAIDIAVLVASLASSDVAPLDLATSQAQVASNVGVGSPAAQSATTSEARADQPHTASPSDSAQAKAAAGKHDLLGITEGASGIAD